MKLIAAKSLLTIALLAITQMSYANFSCSLEPPAPVPAANSFQCYLVNGSCQWETQMTLTVAIDASSSLDPQSVGQEVCSYQGAGAPTGNFKVSQIADNLCEGLVTYPPAIGIYGNVAQEIYCAIPSVRG